MNENPLLRFNREGLGRLRYVNGNAATFLERSRRELLQRLSQWQALAVSAPEDETVDAERLRLEQQYQGERGDLAWEIIRAYSRASHVLTEHLNAYANEKYLGTATQADSLENLLALLDYRPQPPVSASTPLVLWANEGQRGTVRRGLQLRYTPPGGDGPVIFETLRDVAVDAGLNELRPFGYQRSAEPLVGRRLLLEGRVNNLASGQPLVLEQEDVGVLVAFTVQGVRPLQADGAMATEVTLDRDLPPGFVRGATVVHSQAEDRLRVEGPATQLSEVGTELRLDRAAEELTPDTVVVIDDGNRQLYRAVRERNWKRLLLDEPVGSLSLPTARVGRPLTLAVSGSNNDFLAAGIWSYLTGRTIALEPSRTPFRVDSALYRPVIAGQPAEGQGHTVLTLDRATGTENPVFLAPGRTPGPWQVDTFLRLTGDSLPLTLITERPGKTTDGDIAVLAGGGEIAWARLQAVVPEPAAGRAELRIQQGWQPPGAGPFFLSETRLYSGFSRQIRLLGWRDNSGPLTGTALLIEAPPADLAPGRPLLVRGGEGTTPLLTRVVEYRRLQAPRQSAARLVIAHPLPAGFTLGNTVINANVAEAGHGAARPERILGSGNGAASAQSFLLDVENVSFITDAAASSGLRADIEVTVDGEVWIQAPNLNRSGPTDSHYSVRYTEQNWLRVEFGDGTHGRRLPTGIDNVRIRYRQGNGPSGNVGAGALENLVQPHPLIARVRQPLAAAGGAEVEAAESLRRAPPRVFALERAVSLSDFAHLAENHSSVSQAAALRLPPPHRAREAVGIVVIPAGGASLADIQTVLRIYLEERAAPGVHFELLTHRPVFVGMEASVKILRQGDPDRVLSRVREALREAFSPANRRLGRALYRGELYRVVENVPGVDYSLCRIILPEVLGGAEPTWVATDSHGEISEVHAGPDQIIHLDAARPQIAVTEMDL